MDLVWVLSSDGELFELHISQCFEKAPDGLGNLRSQILVLFSVSDLELYWESFGFPFVGAATVSS